jgi:hypothetical protein
LFLVVTLACQGINRDATSLRTGAGPELQIWYRVLSLN